MRIQLKHFLASDWENMYKAFIFLASTSAKNSNSMPLAQHDPPTHKHLFHNLVLRCVEKYFQTTHILAPFSPAPMSFDTTLTLTTLHPKLDNFFMFFLENYELDQDLEFSFDSFKLAF
jgi:hypothetical protein